MRKGSALLLTVIIMSVLTASTLSTVAIRFEQLTSTDRLHNAAIARTAADSGLVKLKSELANGVAIAPTEYVPGEVEAAGSNPKAVTSTANYRPNPRKPTATYEKASTNLPRCISVAVLSPWIGEGRYLFQNSDSQNPALIFNVANIVNDTPLGVIPNNNASDEDKAKSLSEFTKLGHFFNPFAPSGTTQANYQYWTIKFGGPEDEFLTKTASDGNAYYRGLDFLYIPYLPRFVDSALPSQSSGTGIARISATDLRLKFENIIKDNNLKVWIDASIDNATLRANGLGDLFVDNDQYRLTWLQPSLWNDLPEEDFIGPYTTPDLDADRVNWVKSAAEPLLRGMDSRPNLDLEINQMARPFAFVRLDSTQNSKSFSPGAEITGQLYGSLEGLRLQGKLQLYVTDKVGQPIKLIDRTSNSQGRFFGTTLTRIDTTTVSGSVAIRIRLGNSAYETPMMADENGVSLNRNVVGADIGTIYLTGKQMFSTDQSLKNLTLSTDNDGVGTLRLNSPASCVPVVGSFRSCPAVGDLVTFKNEEFTHWGRVSSIGYNSSGYLTSLTVPKTYRTPKPVSHFASTGIAFGNGTAIYVYGGEISTNGYDGGNASEIAELWSYSSNTGWGVLPQFGTPPPPLVGASMVYTGSTRHSLLLFGGYYHEGVSSELDCDFYQSQCLATNSPNFRVAKRLSNDVYEWSINYNVWTKLSYTGATTKINPGTSYVARVLSSLEDRSGLDYWSLIGYTGAESSTSVDLSGATNTKIMVKPTAAGFAVGDDVFLSGEGSFTAWGRIMAINHSTGEVSVKVQGGNGGTVSVRSLSMTLLKRQHASVNCTGGTDGTYYWCDFGTNSLQGYAIGDLVALEAYNSSRVQSVLSGYVSYIEGTKVYFVANEKAAPIKDYSSLNISDRRIAGESAVALPSPRYGATLQRRPDGTGNLAYLWLGAARNEVKAPRMADVWELNLETNVLVLKTVNNMALGSVGSSYSYQTINYKYETHTAGTSPAGGILPASSGWSNSATWSIGLEANSNGTLGEARLSTGTKITVESIGSRGRETFHGIVTAATFTDGVADNAIVKHDPEFPEDTGITGGKNLKVTALTVLSRDGKAAETLTWNGTAFTVATSSLVPPVGATVYAFNTNAGSADTNYAYTFVVESRSYSNGLFTLRPANMVLVSPMSIAYGTNGITSNSNSSSYRIFALTDFNQGFQKTEANYPDAYGAGEWQLPVTAVDTNRNWAVRNTVPSSLNYRPAARQGAAVATITNNPGSLSSAETKMYVAGGTIGRYATLWRESNAGNLMIDTAKPTWSFAKVGPYDAQDIPNLNGGALFANKEANKTAGYYFGGKLRFNYERYDHQEYFTNRMLSRNTLSSSTYSGGGAPYDNSFYIAENEGLRDLEAAGFVRSISDNTSSSSNSFKLRAGSTQSNTDEACGYLGEDGCDPEYLLQLGMAGRLSVGSGSEYGHQTSGDIPMIINPGTAFKNVSGQPSMIMSGPTLNGIQTSGRVRSEGYHPYIKDDNTTSYGTLPSDFNTDKTLMVAGYAKINISGKGGSILVTTSGVGQAIMEKRGKMGDNRTTSYCAASEVDFNSYTCKSGATRALNWLPDAEDLLFLMNAGAKIASIDSYKVIGYYGNVRRAYLVVSRSNGLDPVVQEIAP